MKFNRKNILTILANHQNNIDKRAINPIFSSVRFFSDGQKLIISSMDGERNLQHVLDQNMENFDIFLPCFNLYELLRKSTAQEFELEEQEKNYIIRIGHGEFVFSKYSNQNYPDWIDAYEHTIEIDSQVLANACKLVRWSASSDDSRPFLNGVCIDIQEKINICSTDGLRLALKRLENSTQIRGTWIIGRKSVNDLVKLLEEASGLVKLSLGKNAQAQFIAKSGDAKVGTIWKTLLVAGKFPQYDKIIPTSSVAKLSVNSKEFMETVERMLIIANLNQPIVTLLLSENVQCEISAQNALSSGKDELVCDYHGPDIKISFNGRLLLEILNNLNSKIEFEINNPHAPVLIKPIIEDSDKSAFAKYADSVFILAPVKRD